ncbi:MAG: hypothetical protein P8049_03335, partial [Gemmatimonadota bacterium]
MLRKGALLFALLVGGGCSGKEIVVDARPRPSSVGRSVASVPKSAYADAGTAATDGRSATAATLGIPAGHLPDPG